MNRERRRILERLGVPVLVAYEFCSGCGGPLCPICRDECAVCECCGEFNCERCRVYVLVPDAHTLAGGAALPPPGAGGDPRQWWDGRSGRQNGSDG